MLKWLFLGTSLAVLGVTYAVHSDHEARAALALQEAEAQAAAELHAYQTRWQAQWDTLRLAYEKQIARAVYETVSYANLLGKTEAATVVSYYAESIPVYAQQIPTGQDWIGSMFRGDLIGVFSGAEQMRQQGLRMQAAERRHEERMARMAEGRERLATWDITRFADPDLEAALGTLARGNLIEDEAVRALVSEPDGAAYMAAIAALDAPAPAPAVIEAEEVEPAVQNSAPPAPRELTFEEAFQRWLEAQLDLVISDQAPNGCNVQAILDHVPMQEIITACAFPAFEHPDAPENLDEIILAIGIGTACGVHNSDPSVTYCQEFETMEHLIEEYF